MSVKEEQYRSLRMTRELLFDMLDPKRRPKTVKEMNERVRYCLRHFPFLHKDGEPMFSKL